MHNLPISHDSAVGPAGLHDLDYVELLSKRGDYECSLVQNVIWEQVDTWKMIKRHDNIDETKLSLDELQAEYERSQWALAWALKKLGGHMLITHHEQIADGNNQYRAYYTTGRQGYFIELREHHE